MFAPIVAVVPLVTVAVGERTTGAEAEQMFMSNVRSPETRSPAALEERTLK
jgi:hypothetical protein